MVIYHEHKKAAKFQLFTNQLPSFKRINWRIAEGIFCGLFLHNYVCIPYVFLVLKFVNILYEIAYRKKNQKLCTFMCTITKLIGLKYTSAHKY